MVFQLAVLDVLAFVAGQSSPNVFSSSHLYVVIKDLYLYIHSVFSELEY